MGKYISDTDGKTNKLFRLSVTLPAILIAVTIFACGAVGIIGYVNGREGLEKAASAELSMLARSRESLLNARLQTALGDLSNLASSSTATLALTELDKALAVDKDDQPIRSYYNPEGSSPQDRVALTGDTNKTMYSWRHQSVHGAFASAWKHGVYGDIYVINAEGFINYSVTKSDDFLKKVTDPGIASSALAEVFKRASSAPQGSQIFANFQKYEPIGGEPAIFLAEPVYITKLNQSTLAGIIAIRLDTAFFDAVLSDRRQVGQTGQVYLVSGDGMVLSNKPLASGPTAMAEVAGDGMNRLLTVGGDTSGVVMGAEGQEWLVAISPLTFKDARWYVAAERSLDETMASVVEMQRSMIIGTLLTVLIVALIGVFYARSVTRPLTNLVGSLRAIASGDLLTEIQAARRSDEIGEIGRAVLQIRQNASADQERRAAEDAERVRREAEQREGILDKLARELEATVGQVVQTVRTSSNRLKSSAEEMAAMARSAGENSDRAAELSDQAMTEVHSIASTSDQLLASINEISQMILRSSGVAQIATDRAQSTNTIVQSLAQAADRIGEVVTLISNIADQTNLLALNATIEASRAGEAGRGFAVVASEVKALAAQTGKATEEIKHQIEEIRLATRNTVDAIGEIQRTIEEITDSVTAVSSAVEEQSTATQGIVQNTQRAASDTASVSRDIRSVREVTDKTSDAVEEFVTSSRDIAENAGRLDKEVSRFLAQVRAA